MKDNLYKFLKFLNRNKYIAVFFVFVLSFFAFKNIAFAGSCSLTNIGACFDEIVGGILTSIALFFISFSAYLFGLAFPVFLNITGWLLNSGPINTAWILVRDLVNMFFIFFLLFTSLAKLVGQEKKLAQHSASKQIVYILLSAFLINFSKVICGIIVDIAQIVMLQFTNAFVDSLQNLNSLFRVPGGTTPSVLLGIIFVVFALAFLATALTSLLYVLIRAVSLGIYAALSPLWFLWLSFPTKAKGIDQMKSETMDKFFEAAIGGPILAFYLWISLMLINTGSDGSLTDNVNNAGPGGKLKTYSTGENQSTDAMNSVATDTNSATILKMIVASAVLLFANKQAMSMAKKGGTVMGHGVMNGVVDKVGQIGMKPLDGLKQFGENTLRGAGNLASNAGNFVGAKAGKANDALMGGVKNGIGKIVESNKILKGASRFKDNLAAGSIENAKYVSERKKLKDDLNKAIKSGNPESIQKAKKAISEVQKDQGRKVYNDYKSKGAGEFFLGGAWLAGTAVASTGKALINGEGLNSFKSFAEIEKARLEERKRYMAAHSEKFGKADIDQITARIGKQDNLIGEDKERQKSADYKNSNSRNFGAFKRERDKLQYKQINAKEGKINDGFRDVGLEFSSLERFDDVRKKYDAKKAEYEKKVSDLKDKYKDVKDPEIINKFNKELKELENKEGSKFSNIDSMLKNRDAAAKRVSEIDDLRSNQRTKDDVLKQEASYVKIRNKVDGIVDKKDTSNSFKTFKDELSNISSSLIDYKTGSLKDGANIDFTTMVRDVQDKNGKSKLSVRGNENEFLASLAFAIQNGVDMKDQKALLENANIQSELSSYINSNRADKDLKEEWNKIMDKNKSGISLPKAKIRTEENDAEERARILDIAAKSNNSGETIEKPNEEFDKEAEAIEKAELEKKSKLEELNRELEDAKKRKELNEQHIVNNVGKAKKSKSNIREAETDIERITSEISQISSSDNIRGANVANNNIAQQQPTTPIQVSQDSFTSISRAIKGAVKDLDSSLSSKFDQLIDSIGESIANGGNSEFALSRESIDSLASELHSGMTPDQYNSLTASLNNISSSNQEVKTAVGEVVKALQQQANIQEAKDKQQQDDSIRNAGVRENDSRPQYLRTQKDDHDNGLS